jgi:hypothetical protein
MHPRWLSVAPLVLAAGFVAAQPQAIAPPRDVELYEIDVESSELYWLVYRAGAFARFGHNHVISVGEMFGQVLLRPEVEQSQFEIEILVDGLVVDDPELLARESEQFTTVPTEAQVAGTRSNMLSEAVLDAERHPRIRIIGTGPTVQVGEASLEVTVELLGRSIPLTIPTELAREGDVLEASGMFRLTHEALGMEPFSVMMGALQVGEPMDFVYRIVAHRIE